MRLPIAVTPLNLILIALMIIAPQLGKVARDIVDEKKNKKSLDILISRRAKPQNNKKKKRIDKKRKKTLSRLAILEKAEQSKKINSAKMKSQASVDQDLAAFTKGKTILGSIKSERTNSKPKARVHNKNINKNSFMKQLKTFARNRNFDEAERMFMSRLENMRLAPLESLEKQSKFRDHFTKLVQQLDTESSKN